MIPIRHFDDSQVKLYDLSTNDYYIFNGTKVKVNSVDQLGRYGIVRNNWYSVNVASINQIGRPAPTDPTEPIPGEPTPDDTESYYLNAEISILPWAKRSQNADL